MIANQQDRCRLKMDRYPAASPHELRPVFAAECHSVDPPGGALPVLGGFTVVFHNVYPLHIHEPAWPFRTTKAEFLAGEPSLPHYLRLSPPLLSFRYPIQWVHRRRQPCEPVLQKWGLFSPVHRDCRYGRSFQDPTWIFGRTHRCDDYTLGFDLSRLLEFGSFETIRGRA